MKLSVLEKGVNCAIPNFKKKFPKFASTVENITTNIIEISEEERIILKHQISSAINCAQKQETISKDESTSLKSRRANTNIILVPADKGNMTVMMNTTVIVYILILLVFVFAKFNFDKWIFLDVLWIPT